MEANEHTVKLTEALGRIIGAEQEIAACKQEMNEMKSRSAKAEKVIEAAWGEIAALLAETGEYEVLLPGRANDYKIGYGPPRESVEIIDEEAVPDQFVKLERNPMRKEIGEHLKGLRETGEAMPNWARLEKGERRLTYRLVKKGAA